MKVGWASARQYDPPQGGAELADLSMIARAPEGVEIEMITPGFNAHKVMAEYERIVVSSLRGFSGPELGVLALKHSAVWVHDMEFTGHWLYSKAKPLICLTPTHRQTEQNMATLKNSNIVVNPGWFDTSNIGPGDKVDYALWAHRDIWHKGLDRAKEWAQTQGVELVIMTHAPHEGVLGAMAHAKWFVLLSNIFDPGPRSVMEAYISECELVVDNVGVFDSVSPDQLRQIINTADKEFWTEVLS